MVQRWWQEWRPGQDKVLNNANEDSECVSVLLLKADSCNIALLSDANAERTTEKKHLGLMMLHFFIKESAANLLRVLV